MMLSQGSLKSYSVGAGISAFLTLCSYFLASSAVFSDTTIDLSVAAFAIIQAGAFLYFFLDIGSESTPRWNLGAFLFMLLVAFIIVAGSIWIMHHLDYNLMLKHD